MSKILAYLWLCTLAADQPDNEFSIAASQYDSLAQHNFDCTVVVEFTSSVVYCADGYVSVDQTYEFVGSYGSYNKASLALNMGSKGPRDV
jgi:hypothetical protein